MPPATTLSLEDDLDRESAVPERSLASAVLYQALVDATGGVNAARRQRECDEARTFLTDQSARWRRARNLWCTMAGVDVEAFEQRVAAVLARVDQEGIPMVQYADGHLRPQSARTRLG